MSIAVDGRQAGFNRQLPSRSRYKHYVLSATIILLCFTNYLSASQVIDKKRSHEGLKELHVGALFPMEAGAGGWPGGVACRPAVEMAFDDVNNNPAVLNGYVLNLHSYNSKVSYLKIGILPCVKQTITLFFSVNPVSLPNKCLSCCTNLLSNLFFFLAAARLLL